MAELMRANGRSLGVESAGKWQIRGNGDLILTEDELIFNQWVGDHSVRIPRSAIVAVDGTARSHLGKSVGSALLKVTWTSETGQDSIAWQVADLPAWLAALGGPSPA